MSADSQNPYLILFIDNYYLDQARLVINFSYPFWNGRFNDILIFGTKIIVPIFLSIELGTYYYYFCNRQSRLVNLFEFLINK